MNPLKPCPHQAPGHSTSGHQPAVVGHSPVAKSFPWGLFQNEMAGPLCWPLHPNSQRGLSKAAGWPEEPLPPPITLQGPVQWPRSPAQGLYTPPQHLPGPPSESPGNTQAFPTCLPHTSAAGSKKQNMWESTGRGHGPGRELSQGHTGQAGPRGAPGAGWGVGVMGRGPVGSQAGLIKVS